MINAPGLKAGLCEQIPQGNFEKDLPSTLAEDTDRIFFEVNAAARRKFSEITRTPGQLWRYLQIKSSRHTHFLRG